MDAERSLWIRESIAVLATVTQAEADAIIDAAASDSPECEKRILANRIIRYVVTECRRTSEFLKGKHGEESKV